MTAFPTLPVRSDETASVENILSSTLAASSLPRPEVAAQEETSFAKAFTAFVGDSPFGYVIRKAGQMGFDADPAFQGVFADEELSNYLTQGIPEELWPQLAGAVSLPHAMKIAEDLRDVGEMRRTINGAGWVGIPAGLAAGLIDPVNYATGVATGGISYLNTGGRMARLIKQGFANAALAGGTDAVLSTDNPAMNARGMAANMLAAFGIGGGFGAVLPGKQAARLAARASKGADLAELDIAATIRGGVGANEAQRLGLTPNGEAHFDSFINLGAQQERVESYIVGAGLDDALDADQIAAIRSEDPYTTVRNAAGEAGDAYEAVPHLDGSEKAIITAPPEGDVAGAVDTSITGFDNTVNVPPPPPRLGAVGDDVGGAIMGRNPPMPPKGPPPKVAGDFMPMNADDARAPYVRYSMGGLLGKSDSSSVRFVSAITTDDAVLRVSPDGATTARTESATTWQTRFKDQHLAAWHRRADRLFDKFRLTQRIPWFKAWKARDQTNAIVSQAIRDDAVYAKLPKPLQEMADHARGIFASVLGMAHRHGVALSIPSNKNYVPRLWQRPALEQLIGIHGEDAVGDFIGQAFASAANKQAGIPPSTSLVPGGVVAPATGAVTPELASRVGRGLLKTIMDPSRLDDFAMARIIGGDPDALEAVLRAGVANISEEEIKDVVFNLRKRQTAAGPARFLERTLLDEAFQGTLPNGNRLALASLFENDIDRLIHSYTRSVSAAAAERTILDRAGEHFGAPGKIENWAQLEARMKEDGAAEADLLRLRTVRAHLYGMPHPMDIKNQTVNTIAHRLMAYNVLRTAGGFVFAQVPELGNIVGAAGAGNVLRSLTHIGSMFRRAADGELDNEVLALAENFGIGVSDSITHRVMGSLGPYETDIAMYGSKWDRAIGSANRLQGRFSGLEGINNFSRRMAVLGGYYRLNKLATSAPDERLIRIQQLGLERADAERVGAMIADEANYTTGRHGLRVLDPAKVKDQQAFSMYLTAWDKFVTTAIQKNDIGNLSSWMSSAWGRTIVQFRTFALASYDRHTLGKWQNRGDPEVWSALAATTLLSSLGYYARTHVAAAGLKDRDRREYLKDKLSDAKAIPAIISNAGWTSILPPVIDNIYTGSGAKDGIFSAARYSGLSSGGLFQNPTTDLLGKATGAVKTIGEPMHDKDDRFTRSEFGEFRSLLPFQRAPGIRNALDRFQASRPKAEKR